MTIDYKCPLTIVQIGLKTVHTPTHVSVKVLAFYFLLTRIAHLKQIFCLVKSMCNIQELNMTIPLNRYIRTMMCLL